jgi:riboflavin kinase/FMN adenylyltransferase
MIVSPNEDTLRLLTTKEEKIALFERIGIDHLVIYPFTKEFSELSYNEFVSKILVQEMKIYCLVVGYDHKFGHERKGDFEALSKLSVELGFEVEKLDKLLVENVAVSSTKIRKALDEGNVSKANDFLGYAYTLTGRVIEGNRLGRKLGYPTANIETYDNHKLVPSDGVYAVLVDVRGDFYRGMLNVGTRPTVNYNADHRSIEVHIIDFDEDIYRENITIHFVEKIRDEKRFPGLDELRVQLGKDRETAIRFLS